MVAKLVQPVKASSHKNRTTGKRAVIEITSRDGNAIPAIDLQAFEDGQSGATVRYPCDPNYLQVYISGMRHQMTQLQRAHQKLELDHQELKSFTINAMNNGGHR